MSIRSTGHHGENRGLVEQVTQLYMNRGYPAHIIRDVLYQPDQYSCFGYSKQFQGLSNPVTPEYAPHVFIMGGHPSTSDYRCYYHNTTSSMSETKLNARHCLRGASTFIFYALFSRHGETVAQVQNVVRQTTCTLSRGYDCQNDLRPLECVCYVVQRRAFNRMHDHSRGTRH